MTESSYLINLKVFVKGDAPLNQERFVPIFHRWVKDKVLNDVLIDVTDYRHVHHGPGVMLIAHAANYGLDEAEGRVGLLYSAKRAVTGSFKEQLAHAFSQTLEACIRLEDETATSDPLTFATSLLELRVYNRLVTGRSDAEQLKFQKELEAELGSLFPKVLILSRKINQPREPLSLVLTLDPAAESVRSLHAQMAV